MAKYQVTIWFEPPGMSGDADASFDVVVDAPDEDAAIAMAEDINFLGYSAELLDGEDDDDDLS